MRSKAVLREHIEDVAWIHLAPSYQCDINVTSKVASRLWGRATSRSSQEHEDIAVASCGGLLRWPSPARSSTKLLKSMTWRRYWAPWGTVTLALGCRRVESRREQIPSVKLYGVYGKRRGRAAQGSQRANEDIIASCPALSLGIAALLLKSQHKHIASYLCIGKGSKATRCRNHRPTIDNRECSHRPEKAYGHK